MATQPYQKILQLAQSELSADERSRLAAELMLSTESNGQKRRSLLELEGLGKEIWQGIDLNEYIAQERDSWDD